MKTRSIMMQGGAIAVSIGVMLTLTSGCGTSRVVPGGQGTQSAQASVAPSVTPTAVKPSPGGPTDNEWNVDESKVIIAADVTAAYGDGTKTLVKDALTTASIAYNEIKDLHEARTGDEATYYNPLSDRLTPELYAILIKDALSADATERGKAGGLVPTVDHDGMLLGNGIAYKADPAKPLSWAMVDSPRVSLEVGTTAKDQRADVDMTLALTFPAQGGSILTVTRVLRLNMTLSADGHWLVSGWRTTVAVPLAVKSA